MIVSILMGIVAGSRSMTPLATVAWLARHDALANDAPIFRLLAWPPVVAGALALAIGELAGDKLRSAPHRIVAPGMAARVLASAVAGAALSQRRHQRAASFLGAAAAVASSYATFEARRRAIRRFGQRRSGVVEDVAVVAAALLIASAARR